MTQFFTQINDIQSWLDRHEIKNYHINQDLSVDVDGSVDLAGKSLKFLPVQFGCVSEDFNCGHDRLISMHVTTGVLTKVNKNSLTSLLGCPKEVGGVFLCANNSLTNLIGGPEIVKGDYLCWENQLTCLIGAPLMIGGDFHCNKNELTTLEHGPHNVTGDYNCAQNQLVSLMGSMSNIGGSFFCSKNKLNTLEHGPSHVRGIYSCDENELDHLDFLPHVLEGNFYCKNNPRLGNYQNITNFDELKAAICVEAIKKEKVELMINVDTSLNQVSRTGKNKI